MENRSRPSWKKAIRQAWARMAYSSQRVQPIKVRRELGGKEASRALCPVQTMRSYSRQSRGAGSRWGYRPSASAAAAMRREVRLLAGRRRLRGGGAA